MDTDQIETALRERGAVIGNRAAFDEMRENLTAAAKRLGFGELQPSRADARAYEHGPHGYCR